MRSRVIVWPHTFQNRFLPCSLADDSKPEHLQILALQLIDPNGRIMSTGLVLGQRRDWWASAIGRIVPSRWRLSPAVLDGIVEDVSDDPISMEEEDLKKRERRILRAVYKGQGGV